TMSTPTIPVSEATYRNLQQLAEQTGQSITTVLDQADAYRRKVFFEQLNSAYAALKADPAVWAEIEEERRSMAGSLMDGLDPGESWGDNGAVLPHEGESHG